MHLASGERTSRRVTSSRSPTTGSANDASTTGRTGSGGCGDTADAGDGDGDAWSAWGRVTVRGLPPARARYAPRAAEATMARAATLADSAHRRRRVRAAQG